MSRSSPTRSELAPRLFLPGILMAATGVGAGDLLTPAYAGIQMGAVVLFAVGAGALLKFVVTESLARRQLYTHETLLESWFHGLPRVFVYIFLAYFLLWSLSVGAALLSATGAAATALLPLSADFAWSRRIYAVVFSGIALAVALSGRMRVFEGVMSVLTALMFATVMVCGVLVLGSEQDTGPAISGIPDMGENLQWIVGVTGGVGGTVTILSYGYWIRASERGGAEATRSTRLDLLLAYTLTALFGMSMVVIASIVPENAGRAELPARIAGALEGVAGPWGAFVFRFGFWAAVCSSLLGVWQSVPYIFADFARLLRGDASNPEDLSRTKSYRFFLVALSILPLAFMGGSLRELQLVYAILGALFLPFLAITLLVLNNRADMGAGRNRMWSNLGLLAVCGFFLGAALLRFSLMAGLLSM